MKWYSDNHPDFLWVPDKNSFPETHGDTAQKSVNLMSIDRETLEYASLNAAYELPYGPVVRSLVEASQSAR